MIKVNYKPKSELEKFGVKVYSALVENFPQTFFVGGMVRDTLLKIAVRDIDLATDAEPQKVAAALSSRGIEYDTEFQKLGIIIVPWKDVRLSITTFRKDSYSDSRYPQVTFIKSARQDSQRRDFTINSLYLSLKTNTILDFNRGLKDLKLKQIKFIGDPKRRIKEDPLRIVRALRFALVLNFKLENKTKHAINKSFNLIKQPTKTKLEKEIKKIGNAKKENILKKVINSPNLLDKYFK
jgi:tRNA nucleotidyltransferase (CCA-adding enzyme)